MKRTTLSLIAVAPALAAVVGLAALSAPSPEKPGEQAPAATAKRRPVERTTLTCPRPTTSDFAKTWYTAYTPRGADGSDADGGKATLLPAASDTAEDNQGSGKGKDDGGTEGTGDGSTDGKGGTDGKGKGKGGKAAGARKAKPVAPLSTPGKPATAATQDADAPALIGTADGSLAPGYTASLTTEVSAGEGRGLLGTSCGQPEAEFWFPGVSTADGREDYVHLTNPDATPAVVDLELYGKNGAVDTPAGDGLTVPAHATVPVLLSTLSAGDDTDLTLRVLARSGRVGAALEAVDSSLGGDWLPASSNPAPGAVLPGLPKDTVAARLVVFAPQDDADLNVRLATPTGSITPAGNETLHVKSGMMAVVNLDKITQGEAGSLVLTPSDPDDAEPIVAGLRVVRGKGAAQEMGFLAAAPPVEERATAAGSGVVADSTTTLYLTAPDKAAKVRVTTSAATGGGTARSTTVNVRAGATVALTPDKPSGKGGYAVTVERVSGGPLYASRMLARVSEGVPEFTLQVMPDDRGTVAVPAAVEDTAVLN